jgi:polyhydroxyalkanoate synthesis regulator phasin
MQTPEPFFSHLGEMLISGALAAIGWVMATFTRRHIESMDKLTSKIGSISEDVSAMKSDIGAIRSGQERLENRVSRLEDHERERP